MISKIAFIFSVFILAASPTVNANDQIFGTECPLDTDPVLFSGASQTEITSWKNNSPPTLDESYVSCTKRNNSGLLTDYYIINREGDEELSDVYSPKDLSKSKVRNSRWFPLYGDVLITLFSCRTCDWSKPKQMVRFVMLHWFSIWGESYSDYRALDIDMIYKNGKTELRHKDILFNTVLLSTGARGVTHLRLSVCNPSNGESLAKCYKNPKGKLQKKLDIDLEALPEVNP